MNTCTARASTTLAANTTHHVYVSAMNDGTRDNIQRTSSNAEDIGGAAHNPPTARRCLPGVVDPAIDTVCTRLARPVQAWDMRKDNVMDDSRNSVIAGARGATCSTRRPAPSAQCHISLHSPTPESRPAPRRPRRVALACAALALLGLLAHPSSASAQTVVWTATFTPADLGFNILGCSALVGDGVQSKSCRETSILSQDSFTHDSTDYSVTQLFLRNTGAFEFFVDTDITTATAALTLEVGSTSLVLADANVKTARKRSWNNTGVSLTAGTSVTVKLTELDETPPTLTSATVSGSGGSIALAFSEDLQSANLPLAAAFTVTVGGTPVTVSGVAAGAREDVLQITVSPLIGQGQAVVVAYADPTDGDDANAIQDTAGNDTPDFTTGAGGVPAVTNDATIPNAAPDGWSLKPTGLVAGDQFRLLFLSSTKRNATATDIATYNTFIQNLAAAGHTDIRTYSAGFRAVGCTAAVDARDNTSTTGTGVPIYWLDGTKVADDYVDFYDGSWDDEINDTNESGTDAHDTSLAANYPFTGCANDGTEEFAGATNPRGLGATTGFVRVGRLNASGTLQDPIDGNDTAQTTDTRPLYGLSAVFEVTTVDTTSPTLVSATVTSLGLGTVIRMDFDEKLKRPSGGQFPAAVVSLITVTVDGVEVDLSALASTDGISVNLHLQAGAKIRSGQTVVIAYFDDTSGNDPLVFEDNAGNDVATFTTGMNGVPPVTNNSTVAPVAPGAPTGLTATANGSAQIDLSWTAPADNGGRVITGYKIEVSSDAGNAWTTHLADTTSADTTYEHTGLAAGTTRHYRVSAINTIGTSAASNVDDATTGAGTNNTAVPNNWSLKPTGLAVGYQFRLLFLSSTKRNAQATDIAVYNTFIQTLAAAGHTDIRDYSAGFRVVGCTADTDARDNTSTNHTGTGTAKGVPIYWLDGTKAADDYADFYDGSWDDEANDKNESGTNSHDTSMALNYPWTGCGHDGTEAVVGTASFALGTSASIGSGVGRPNSSAAVNGPLGSDDNAVNTSTRPMYGLSAVFQVATAVVVNNPPTFSANTAARSVAENTAAGQNVGAALTATDANSDTLTYTLEGTDAASFDIDSTSGQILTKAGVTYNHEAKSTYTVIVKADDGNGGTDTVTVTITVTDVNEPPGVPAVPLVTATSGSTTSLDVTWTAPTNTGPAITSYDLQYREGTSGSFTAGPQNVTGTSAAIASLMASTSHQVQVRATNAEGDSDWSGSGTGRTGNTAPAFSSSTAARSVAENTAAGQNVGAALTATDGDSDTLTYTLEGADAASFDIASTSGQIRTKAGVTYNHEAKSTHTVIVKADDGNGGTDTVTVTITVTDVNEPPGVPAVPLVTATSGSTTSLDVTWTAPANTGPAITSYDLQYREGTSGSFTDGPQNVTGTSAAIASLMASTSHQVQVRATNAEGDSDWSGSGTGRTGNTAPAFSSSTAARSVAENTAAGQNVGAALTATDGDSDTLTYTLEGADAASFDIASTSGQIRTKAGVTYNHEAKSTHTVIVKADDGNGGTDTVTVTITVTDVAEPPGRPAAPSVSGTSGSTTSLDVTWTAPANTGPAITSYDLQYREGTSGSFTAGPQNETGTSAAIASLMASTSHQVQVRATNAEGDGAWSFPGTGRTGASVPGAPTSLSATASGSTRIDLSWTAPGSNGGSAITGYRIEISSDGGANWTVHVATTGNPATTYSHIGLAAGTTRHYRVSAINANGAGAASNTDNATTTTVQTTVRFGAAAYTATEGGADATVAVVLSAAPSAPVTIPLTKAHVGGATATDYSSVPANVTFPTGQTRQTFTLRATDDSQAEGDERVRFGFGSLPSGYASGSPRTATVTLIDDDAGLILSFGTSWSHTVKVRESDTAWHRFTVDLRTHKAGPLDGNPQQAFTIPLEVTHTGSAGPEDYEGIPASVTFGVGQNTTFFRMRALPDRKKETGEGLRLDFGALPAGLSKSTWGPYETIELLDEYLPDLTVRFGAEAYTAREGAAAAQVSIHLSEPVDVEPLDVRLSVQPGGGATGDDYSGIPSVVTFAVGEQTKTIMVTATDDSDDDDGESVSLSFVNAPNDRLITGNGPVTATVALEDNDGPAAVEVSFEAATYTATEGGTNATVSVELDKAPGRTVTVPLTQVRAGGATPADYSAIPANVAFGPNETSKTVTVIAVDDSDPDGGESVRIGFGALPDGVLAGRPAATVVTLADGTEQTFVVSFGTSPTFHVQAREGNVGKRLVVYLSNDPWGSAGNAEPRRPVTIPLVVTYRGGATGADHTPIPASVTFEVGSGRAGFNVRALPDGQAETGESLRLDFGPLPPGVTKGRWGYETIDFVDEAPVPAGLSVSGWMLTMGYSLALDGGSTPSGRDFVVLAGAPGAESVVPVTSASVDGDAVLLALARPVAADETVTLTYLPAAMHPIRNAAGVAVAPLADEPVRNETGAPGRLSEAGLAAGIAMRAPLHAAQGGAGGKRLDLSWRNLTDVSALAGLTGVRELDLSNNAITDLSPLAGLTGLRALDLSGNRIEDISMLAGLTALERLGLSGNRIEDISTLAGLSGLEVLDLSGNRVEELWPLVGLTALERLNLSGNRVEELSPLEGLGSLQVLLLDGNRVAEILGLLPLAGLANLGLSDNQIEDIGLLANLGQLRRLDLSGNAVADVSALGEVSGLLWLRLPGNPVSDVAPLGQLENLRWLWLDSARVAGMEALAPHARRGAAPLWIERVPAQ